MSDHKILVVDDNHLNLKLMSAILLHESYNIQTASNAQEAIDVLKDFDPRVILMDIQMPGLDGLQLTKMLKADVKTRDIAIIGVTAYAMKGDREKILEAGCDDYISKPIDTPALLTCLKKYFE